MLKQVTIKNLYNFKNELTLDFINDGSSGLNIQFKDDYIANFTLIYGKNNVGKSNLLKILDEVKEFVLNNNLKFKPYWPKLSLPYSLFEVVIENKVGEIRYGFEINIETLIINDEWLHFTAPLERSEQLLYSRKDQYFSDSFDKSDSKTLKSLKSTILYLNHFNNINHKYLIINETSKFFKDLTLIKCDHLSKQIKEEDLNKLSKLSENDNLLQVLNAFLSAADVDIDRVDIYRLNEQEFKIINLLKEIEKSSISNKNKTDQALEIVDSNKKEVLEILSKKMFSSKLSNINKNISVDFVHKSEAHFDYADLSSGTKKILSIALVIIDSINSDKILLFDEIENNLHIELIHLTISFIKSVVTYSPQLQILISTHRDELLDYSFISNENKLFMKIDPKSLDIRVDYLSQYKLLEHHLASKRYALNAFNTNPNTSKEYKLNLLLDSLLSGDKDE